MVIWLSDAHLTPESLALSATLLQVSGLPSTAGLKEELGLTGFEWSTDIHSSTLGLGKSDDSLARIPEIKGELAMVSKLF